MSQPERITAEPNPVPAGQTLKVCYDFPSDGPSSVTITFAWMPDSIPGDTETVSRDGPCVIVSVPEDAVSLNLSALGSADLGVTVS